MNQMKRVLTGAGIIVLAVAIAWGVIEFNDSRLRDMSDVEMDPAYDGENSAAFLTISGTMETPDRSFTSVSETELNDDAEIITIQVGDQHYAFPKNRMDGQGEHIVSELFDGQPLAVTYCNESECVRVFKGPVGGDKLDIAQQGLENGSLAIFVDGVKFIQESPDIPYDDYEFQLTSWGIWKTEHPTGLVLILHEWE